LQKRAEWHLLVPAKKRTMKSEKLFLTPSFNNSGNISILSQFRLPIKTMIKPNNTIINTKNQSSHKIKEHKILVTKWNFLKNSSKEKPLQGFYLSKKKEKQLQGPANHKVIHYKRLIDAENQIRATDHIRWIIIGLY
jgi:hypothetical protein